MNGRSRFRMKLAPRTIRRPSKRVILDLDGQLADDLETYQALFREVHGNDIELSTLAEEIVRQFLASDEGLDLWRGSARNHAS